MKKQLAILSLSALTLFSCGGTKTQAQSVEEINQTISGLIQYIPDHRIDESIKVYKMIIKLKPDDKISILELAKIYSSRENLSEAEKLLTTYIKKDSTNLYVRLELARIYIKRGKD